MSEQENDQEPANKDGTAKTLVERVTPIRSGRSGKTSFRMTQMTSW